MDRVERVRGSGKIEYNCQRHDDRQSRASAVVMLMQANQKTVCLRRGNRRLARRAE